MRAVRLDGAVRGGLRQQDLIILSDLRSLHLGCVEREHKFSAQRRWKFDFAVPKAKLACEIEGAIWTNGRHTRGAGFIADCDKYNFAVSQGWAVLRFPTQQVLDGTAHKVLEQWKRYFLDNQVKPVQDSRD